MMWRLTTFDLCPLLVPIISLFDSLWTKPILKFAFDVGKLSCLLVPIVL